MTPPLSLPKVLSQAMTLYTNAKGRRFALGKKQLIRYLRATWDFQAEGPTPCA